MSTGFGYVRDSKPNIINWADIGKQMSDAISADQADRQGRKDDIAKQDAEYAKSLLDQPQGSYEEANRFISDFSQQAAQQALRDLQDLKRGALSEQEYYQRRANLKSGTDLMFTAGKKFNENYGAAMESIKNGESSVLLADLKGKMEGYLNFANSGAYINPFTASVNVSTRDKDGNISSKPGDFMTASELVNLSTEDFAKFKLDDTIKNISDALGKITYRDAQGRTITASTVDFDLLDKNDQKKFQNKFDGAMDDQVNAIVGGINSKIAASILADYSDEDYELSFDLNETDPNKIVYDPKGNVVLTDDQLEKAKKIVKDRLRSQLDATIMERLPKTPTGTQTKNRKELDANRRLGRVFRDALAAKDPDTLVENLESIQKFNKNIKNIRKVGRDTIEYQFINAQGELVNETISLSDDIKSSVEKGLQDLLGPKVDVSEITEGISFKGYKITETEGVYQPTLVKRILTVQDPSNFIQTVTSEGVSTEGNVVTFIGDTAKEFRVNDDTGKKLQKLFFHQGFEDFDYELTERKAPDKISPITGRPIGNKGGRRIIKGIEITVPSANFEQLNFSKDIILNPNKPNTIFIESGADNIEDIITEILTKATDRAINLERNIKQDKGSTGKKNTPISSQN